MEFLGFAAVAVVLIGGAVLLGWLVRRTGRNDNATHGGGVSGSSVDSSDAP